jgi:co-chaperonin GroES (HSP10)
VTKVYDEQLQRFRVADSINRMKMEHAENPAEKIAREMGDLSKVEMLFNTVLVATYLRPEKTASGVYLPDKVRDEDRFQGKVGLVMMIGPTAFTGEGDVPVRPGEWIVYRPSDAWETMINGRLCRVLQDIHVKMRVPAPDVVW